MMTQHVLNSNKKWLGSIMGWKLKTRKRNVTIGKLIETRIAFQAYFTRNHKHISDKFIRGIEWIQSHRLAGKQL